MKKFYEYDRYIIDQENFLVGNQEQEFQYITKISIIPLPGKNIAQNFPVAINKFLKTHSMECNKNKFYVTYYYSKDEKFCCAILYEDFYKIQFDKFIPEPRKLSESSYLEIFQKHLQSDLSGKKNLEYSLLYKIEFISEYIPKDEHSTPNSQTQFESKDSIKKTCDKSSKSR